MKHRGGGRESYFGINVGSGCMGRVMGDGNPPSLGDTFIYGHR